MKKNAPAPLLKLTTAITRSTITIDGKVYALRAKSELSILEEIRLQRFGKKISDLPADFDEIGLEPITAELGTIVPMLVADSDEVIVNLSERNQLAILKVFNNQSN